MYRVGQKEIEAITRAMTSGKLFRYHEGGECERFEQRYAKSLGVQHCAMTASGTNSLVAALVGVGIGPGDEVIVPACTYMASALAVVSVGAIPVIVDIDDSILLSPEALENAVGPRTAAVIPVHMWGLPCDMDAIMEVAGKHDLKVVEDACQAVGGGYKDKMLGAIGDVGAFSFNYFKNMTCGEGGAVVSDSQEVIDRVRCTIDPCSFYWKGRKATFTPFVANGARASEFEGAMMNVQLDRLAGMIGSMRRQKKRILEETADCGLVQSPCHSPDSECGTHVLFKLPDEDKAMAFAEAAHGTVCGKTGRHVYTEWDPIFAHAGAHHEALNPFKMKENEGCRMDYSKDMCRASLEILNRTVMIATHPDNSRDHVTEMIRRIRQAAETVL